ncbi:MAG: hypothetical protein K2H01_05350 [Ruminococcus sp.]|nr:hypothetical protein [Ruminococcus sp.]
MKRKKRKNRKSHSMVVVLFLLMAIILDVLVIGVADYVYIKDIRESYSRMCSGAALVIASSVDGNIIDEMMEGEADEQYAALKNQMENTLEQIPNLEHIYIYDIQRDGIYLLIDTDLKDYKIGDKIPYPPPFKEYKDLLCDGKTPGAFESKHDGQFYMTSLLPVCDLRGNCVCYVGCDIDMDEAYANRIEFIKHLAVIVSVPTFVIALGTAIFIKRRILSSIDCLDDYLKLYHQDN